MTEQGYKKLFRRYRPIWKAFEENGWTVKLDGNEVTLGNYSPAGEELCETLYLDGEESIVKQLYALYDNFDEEEHATMWLDAKRNGVNGVPSIQTLVHDAERISEMYLQLFLLADENYKYCKGTK